MNAIPFRDLLQAFKRGWKTLLFVHLAVAVIAGTIIAPLAAVAALVMVVHLLVIARLVTG